MKTDEIVLKGGVTEDGLKVIVKDGNGRFLFAVVDDGEGNITLQDVNGNDISGIKPGTLPTTAAASGKKWAFTYDPDTQEYSWEQVDATA